MFKRRDIENEQKNDAVMPTMLNMFMGPACARLFQAGLPGSYAETMARKIITESVKKYKKMDIEKFILWNIKTECSRFEESMMEKYASEKGKLTNRITPELAGIKKLRPDGSSHTYDSCPIIIGVEFKKPVEGADRIPYYKVLYHDGSTNYISLADVVSGLYQLVQASPESEAWTD